MPLPLTTDTLDEIPENARGGYIEKEGKFVLDIEVEDTGALKRALQREREEAKERAKEAKALADQLAAVKREREDADLQQKGLSDFKKKWDEEQLKPVAEKLSAAEKRISELTFGAQMNDLLSDKVVNLGAARKIFDDLYTLDENGKLVPKDDPTADAAKHFAALAAKDMAFVLKGTQASGGGAAGAQLAGNGAGGAKPVIKWSSEEIESYINTNGADAYQTLLDQQLTSAMQKAVAA